MRVYVDVGGWEECAGCGGSYGFGAIFPYWTKEGWAFRCEGCAKAEGIRGGTAETYVSTWSGRWYRKHWLGALGLVLVGLFIGYVRGESSGRSEVFSRVEREYPRIARAMTIADSLEAEGEPERDPDEIYDKYRGD